MSETNEPMIFGFNRDADERSLKAFIGRIAAREMLDELVPRLSEGEIGEVVSFFTGLMKKHLDEKEYHRLFLGED